MGNWIPLDAVSVLPAPGKVTLISLNLANGQRESGIGAANGAGGWQVIYMPSQDVPVVGVGAWMPLPAAYKGDYPLG